MPAIVKNLTTKKLTISDLPFAALSPFTVILPSGSSQGLVPGNLLDPTIITSSMSLTQPPSTAAFLQFIVDGGVDSIPMEGGSGRITITGTDSDDNTQTETLIFNGNGSKDTEKRFKTVTSVDTEGFTNESTVATLQVRECKFYTVDLMDKYTKEDVESSSVLRDFISRGMLQLIQPIRKHVHQSYSVAQTDTAVWTPASGKRIRLTDYRLSVGTAMTVTLKLGNSELEKFFFSQNGGAAVNLDVDILGEIGEAIKITTNINGNASISLDGYEE